VKNKLKIGWNLIKSVTMKLFSLFWGFGIDYTSSLCLLIKFYLEVIVIIPWEVKLSSNIYNKFHGVYMKVSNYNTTKKKKLNEEFFLF
jgi:hypothetical protein